MRLPLFTKRVLFSTFGIVFLASLIGCGQPASVSVPTPNKSDCSDYSSISSQESVVASPPGGYQYLPTVALGGAATFVAAKVTITSGLPPFLVSSQSFAVMALKQSDADSATFSESNSYLAIAVSDAISSATDASCSTYVFWVRPAGTFPKGTYGDTLTISDSKGNLVFMPIDITVAEST